MTYLENESVALRPLQENDARFIAEACAADQEIGEWLMRLHDATEVAATAWINEREASEQRGEQVTRAVVARGGDRFLGAIWLGRFDQEAKRSELAYWTAPAERGRGVATAAIRLMSRFAFQELALVRVQILAAPQHRASQRVAENAGFTREGTLRSYRKIAGEHSDLVVYSLLASDSPS